MTCQAVMLLESRRPRADFILSFMILKGAVDVSPSDFLLQPPRASLRRYTYRLVQGPRVVFSVRVVKYWSRLTSPLVMSPSASVFKNSWVVDGPQSFVKHLRYFYSPSQTWFSVFIDTPHYLYFPHPQISLVALYIWSLLAHVANPIINT